MTARLACVKAIPVQVRRFIFLGTAGLLIFGLEQAIISGLEPGVSLKIAAGFLALFFFPGVCLAEIFLKQDEADFADRAAFGFLLSLGLCSFPGLAFFVLKAGLETVFWTLLWMGIIIWLISLGKLIAQPGQPASKLNESADFGRWAALLLIIGSAALAWFVGASRGPETDWDLYNYISMVRKFLVWGRADIHHYFYIDAPPDPVHSYNLHALIWAAIAYQNRLDPIPLYIHSAFLTVPLCFFSFFSFSRRALAARPGFLAFAFYFFFQLLFAGLYFVGNSTFYPDDTMWLLAFPALLSLAFLQLEKPSRRLLVLTALSALSVSIVHPLWGLAFYIVLVFYLAGESCRESRALRTFRQSQKERNRVPGLLFFTLLSIPYLLSVVYIVAKAGQEPKQWFNPLFPYFPLDHIWFYGLIFIAAPIVIFITIAPMKAIAARLKESVFFRKGYFRTIGALILVSVVVALPYAFLRGEAIQNTQWASFGRNPYRGLITPVLYLLNPFKRSFTDPNMTFHPVFWLGLFLSPWLFWLGRSKSRPLALAGFYGLAGVVLLVLHPVLATFFAKLFTLGYLRRILRLLGLLSFLPIAAFLESVFSRLKLKNIYAYGSGMVLAALISSLLMMVPVQPLYGKLFERMINLTRAQNQNSLMADDTPFRFLGQHQLIESNDVIYSDLYTSFRATAYLGCYVAVQAKPGVGVPNQDQRRIEEMEFFSSETSLKRMADILKKRKATWVIINRNPQYQFYGISLGHPDAIGKLASDPGRFEKVYDQGDWVIFRVRS